MQTLTPFPAEGAYSWLTEENLLAQVDYMAEHLLRYGYEYINIEAGWWREWDWTPVSDEYGRPAVWEPRHPSGMEWFVDYVHSKGLKVGIYMPAGLEPTQVMLRRDGPGPAQAARRRMPFTFE
jgi:hypothetical protein